jgi:hypothetical protein
MLDAMSTISTDKSPEATYVGLTQAQKDIVKTEGSKVTITLTVDQTQSLIINGNVHDSIIENARRDLYKKFGSLSESEKISVLDTAQQTNTLNDLVAEIESQCILSPGIYKNMAQKLIENGDGNSLLEHFVNKCKCSPRKKEIEIFNSIQAFQFRDSGFSLEAGDLASDVARKIELCVLCISSILETL